MERKADGPRAGLRREKPAGDGRLRHHLAIGGLLAGTCLSSAACAQAVFTTPPPERVAVDKFGVDRVAGTVSLAQTELAIGPSGPGGLAVVQSFGGGGPGGADGGGNGGGGTTNWDLIIYSSGATYTVGLGSTGDQFTLSGTTFTSTTGSGATLTRVGSVFTYTTRDGVVFTYDYQLNATGEFNVEARASKIVYPTGETTNLTWVTVTYCSTSVEGCPSNTYITRVRLQSVSNSQGYQLHYNYAANGTPLVAGAPNWSRLTSISGINTALDYCDPSAATCTTPNQTPPKALFAAGGSSTEVTDALGRQTNYAWGTGSFSVQRPTSSSPDDVYTISTDGNDTVSKVVHDGQT